MEESEQRPLDTELEEGRRLFMLPCKFVISAAEIGQVPALSLPEVAFAGRSNVGKSSLVNALTNRRTLAHTSNTPGRTRLLNFFDLGGRLTLADLPGYGYARASKADIARWSDLTRSYLKGRAELLRVCLLIDARHGFKDADRDYMKQFDGAAVSYQIVLTKSDKVKPVELPERLHAVRRELVKHPAAHPEILATSAESGAGIAELRATLAALAAPGS